MKRVYIHLTLLACFLAFVVCNENILTATSEEHITEDREMETKACTGKYKSIGRFLCHDNAQCWEARGFFTCLCRDGYHGDGWILGKGCTERTFLERRKRAPYIPGMWVPWSLERSAGGSCKGFKKTMGVLICHATANCVTLKNHFIKCRCPPGSRGSGLRHSTGCS